MNRRWLVWGSVAALLAGCSPGNREELSRGVVQQDPAFRAQLDRRDAIEGEVDDLRAELAAKRAESDRQIRALQRAFRQVRKDLESRIRERLAQLEPEREKLRLDIRTTEHQIRAHEAAVRGFQQTIAELRRSMKTAAPTAASADGTVPPTGGPTGPIDGELAQQLTDAQAALQAAQTALNDQRHHQQLLRDKLRLLRVD